MNTFLTVFYATRRTFDFLDELYEDELNKKCNLILFLIGINSGIQTILASFKDIERLANSIVFQIIVSIILLLLSGGLFIILGKFVLSYLIYGISRLLKGKSNILETQIIVSYAMIPSLLSLPVFLTLYLLRFYGIQFPTGIIIAKGFYLIITLIVAKIMIVGLIKFNKYGILKALINYAIFLALILSLYLMMN